MFQTREKIEDFSQKLQEIKARDDLDLAGKVEIFKKFIAYKSLSDAERLAASQAEEEKKTKEVVVEDQNWSKEDI